MICENNLQPDLCCLYYGAMEWPGLDGPWGFGAVEYKYLSIYSNILVILWHGPDGPRGFGAVEYRYPSICSNIPVIVLEQYTLYNYDLSI